MRHIRSAEVFPIPVSHDSHIEKQVYLKQGEVSGILQWATATLNAGDSITPHYHPDATEVFQILEGSMKVQINDNTHKLTANDLLVVEPGETHAFQNPGSAPCSFVYTLLKS